MAESVLDDKYLKDLKRRLDSASNELKQGGGRIRSGLADLQHQRRVRRFRGSGDSNSGRGIGGFLESSGLNKVFRDAKEEAAFLGDVRRGDRLQQKGFENRISLGELALGKDKLSTAIDLGNRELDIKKYLGEGELDVKRSLGEGTIGVNRSLARTQGRHQDLRERRFNENLALYKKLTGEDAAGDALQQFLKGRGDTSVAPGQQTIEPKKKRQTFSFEPHDLAKSAFFLFRD